MSDTKNVTSKDSNPEDAKKEKENVQTSAKKNVQTDLKAQLDKLKAEKETLAKEKESLAELQSKKDLTVNEMRGEIEALRKEQDRLREEREINDRLLRSDYDEEVKATLRTEIQTLTLGNLDSTAEKYDKLLKAGIERNKQKVNETLSRRPDEVDPTISVSIKDAKSKEDLRAAYNKIKGI